MKSQVFTGPFTREISFPVGGIGAGCIGLAGSGAFVDWEIQGHPDKGAINRFTHFAIKAENSSGVKALVLQGDNERELSGHCLGVVYDHKGFGYGPDEGTMAGFPHFEKHTFEAAFPWAKVSFEDADFPGKPSLTAFSSFIPLNSADSSLPAAFYSVAVENTSGENTDYTVALTLGSPFKEGVNKKTETEGASGVLMTEGENSLCALTDSGDSHVQCAWYRGRWFDPQTDYWNSFTAPGFLPDREYPTPGRDPSTLEVKVSVAPGSLARVNFVIAWRFPAMVNDWDGEGVRSWTHWYALRFPSALDAALYAIKERARLRRATFAFRDAFYSQSLDENMLFAAGRSLSTLVTPVCLRLPDGSFWAWEGASEKGGSCEGTCEHVWNYAYALPYLFPDLEMSVRRLEKEHSQWDDGHISFRLRLPPGRGKGWYMPCVDGQMGYIIKIYREWRHTGDDEWLEEMYPSAKRALEFAWVDTFVKWDPDRDGVITGRQHHTLDMELFGASSWLEGFYLAALRAMSKMGAYLGEDVSEYDRLYASGREYLNNELFNGRNYCQKVDLSDATALEKYRLDTYEPGGGIDAYMNEETGEIKYQIGEGIIIDQALAQWHADLTGLGEIFDEEKLVTALRTMFDTNFKPEMRRFANPCRVFSANGEAGLVMCGFPEGAVKPRIPIPYCEETMTGFEYAAAGLYLAHGMKEEAVRIVKAVADRYDGKKRNPFNEIECGSNYSRTMAAFALPVLWTGFDYDAPNGSLRFIPVDNEARGVWFASKGWGGCELTEDSLRVDVTGEITVKELVLPFVPREVFVDGAPAEFTVRDSAVILNESKCAKASITAL